MRQQINLYQPIFSEERTQLSAAALALGLGVLLIALAAFSVNANLRVRKLAIEVESLREQQAQQESFMQANGRDSPDTIEARVKQLDKLVTERGRALRILQSGAAGTTLGFAPRLEALARRHVEGLWIDAIHLSSTNGAMSLSGATFNPDIVPIYLRSLAQDQVLSGTRFDDFIIERPIAASISTEAEEGQPKAKPVDPKLVRFRAGSTNLKRADSEETPS